MPTLNINIPDADETTKGIAEVATQVETDAGTDDNKILTPLKLESSAIRAEVTANTAKVGITPTQASDITANNAKVTNATHTGQVTGSGALTVDKTAITDQTAGTVASGDLVLIADVDDSNNLKKVTAQSIADLGGGGGVTYAMYWGSLLFNPADSTRYWLCPSDQIAPNTGTNGNRRHKLFANTSTFYLHIGLATGGSTEAATWVIRNHTQSTEANFSPTHPFTASGQANAYVGSASLSCNAGDYVELILDTPAWATNPTSVRASCTVTYTEE